MKIKKLLLCVTAGVLALSINVPSFAYTCLGIIDNISNANWTFIAYPNNGKVHFVAGVNCLDNGPCLIPAHTNVPILYSTNWNTVEGNIKIADSKGVTKQFNYFNTGFVCPVQIATPYGDFEGVRTNDPGSGCITMWKDSW